MNPNLVAHKLKCNFQAYISVRTTVMTTIFQLPLSNVSEPYILKCIIVTCSYFDSITETKRPESEGDYWFLSGAEDKNELKSTSSVSSFFKVFYFKRGEKLY